MHQVQIVNLLCFKYNIVPDMLLTLDSGLQIFTCLIVTGRYWTM